MKNGRKFFITGGAGFIGSRFIKDLQSTDEVIVYDNLSRNALKDEVMEEGPTVKIIKGDILNYKKLKDSIPLDVDYVLHMAAIAGIDTVIENTVKTMKVNLVGLFNLLKALQEKNVTRKIKRFINFSTSEVAGVKAFRVKEKSPANLQPVGEARWTYSVSKLAGEHLAYSYFKEHDLKVVTVRPFNIYGPGQVGEGAIHEFVIRAIEDRTLEIHGEGNQIRSWCYIDDLLQGVKLCLKKEEAVGEVFHLGNPRGTITILQLAKKIIRIADSNSKIKHVPKGYEDVKLRIPNIDKAQNLLGLDPKVDLEEGLRRTIIWYEKEK